jgi:predicted outer membrane protein
MGILRGAFGSTGFVAISIWVALALNGCSHGKQAPAASKEEKEETHVRSREKDISFLAFVSEMSMDDKRLAQLAQRKSGTKEIKEFGKKIEAGHTMVLKHIAQFSEKKGIPVSPKPSEENEYKALIVMQGTDFDSEFCAYMLQEHENAIDKFEAIASDPSVDADIRIWAESIIPVFRSNLEEANALQEKTSE